MRYDANGALTSLYYVRRVIWNLIRVENEHLNNVDGFRATSKYANNMQHTSYNNIDIDLHYESRIKTLIYHLQEMYPCRFASSTRMIFKQKQTRPTTKKTSINRARRARRISMMNAIPRTLVRAVLLGEIMKTPRYICTWNHFVITTVLVCTKKS